MGDLGKPSIGVIGFSLPDEVHQIIMRLADHQDALESRPMEVGVLMDDESISGAKHWSVLFPEREAMEHVFQQASEQGDRMTSRIVHFHTRQLDKLSENLMCLREYGGRSMEGVELSCGWPPLDQLEATKPPFFRRVILKLQPQDLARCGNSNEIAARIADYSSNGLITDVFVRLDKREILGQNFLETGAWLHAIAERCPDLGIGASGIYPSEVNLLHPLFARFPRMSVESMMYLRSLDYSTLCPKRVANYVLEVSRAFEQIRREAYLENKGKG